ncbi:MAG: universal stress protein [Pseudomonadota bacterium]
MYDHILVPVAVQHEGRGPAMLKAADSLLSEGGKITLFHVTEIIPNFAAPHIPAELLADEARSVSATLRDLSEQTKAQVEIKTAIGSPARKIVDAAQELGADCIVIASHDPQLADYLLGSTAAWVARHAECSVHIIR